MADLSPFATHFSHLVWLCAQQADNLEGQKEQLRNALKQLSTERAILVLHDVSMAVFNAVSSEEQGRSLVWFAELSVRMASHSVRALEFDVATPAREVMALAQLLASAPVPGDGGVAFDAELVEQALTGVTAHIGPEGFVRRAITQVPASTSPARTPAIVGAIGHGAMPTPGRMTPVALRAAPGRSTESQQLMQQQLMPPTGEGGEKGDLVVRLRAASASANAPALVDDVTRTAEDHARAGAWHELVAVLHCLYELHDQQHDGDLKRACLMGARRLQKPALLQGVARLLPEHRDLRETIAAQMARAGEAGADALIDLLISSDVSAERRAYRDALGANPASASALLHLLGDERWYVVRNAVELLGELAPADVDARVAGVMSHPEPRVRRAAAIALGRLGTSRAMLALMQALEDESPEVRRHAAHAIGAARNTRVVPWLVEALDREADAEVQEALVTALGGVATDDAVARLIRAAESGGFLLRKPQGLRLRAIEALGAAATPAAVSALRDLKDDRDAAIREAAQHALSRTRTANGRAPSRSTAL